MKKTMLIVAGALIVLFAIVIIVMSITTKNSEIRLRAQIEAKIDVNKSHYTKMWEILVNEAGVTKEYAKNFKEIYPELIAGRYSNGQGQMMQWIQENNPTFDTSLYNKLMVSIEAQRESFHTTQTQLIDLSRQHNILLKVFPSRLFLSSIEPIDIPVIINDASEKAFETGKEVDMKLFK